jgi:vitamin B12 transporter
VTPEFSPVKNLLLIASVKGITDGRDIVPIPKLGWSWSLNGNTTIKNNYFRSFKFPDFDDLYWVQNGMTGNADLKNEDGWGADFGAEFFVKDLLSINSTLYGEWTDNSIHWSNISGKWRPENYGIAAFLGWDNSLRLTIPFSPGFLEKPVLNISWLFQMSWLLTGDLAFEDDKRIPYMPVHTLGASLELPWKTTKKKLPGSFAVSGRFEGQRYADTANYRELAALFLLNFALNQKLNKNINIFGKVNNALNTRYFSYIEYPMPGISLTAGLRMEFEESPLTGRNY